MKLLVCGGRDFDDVEFIVSQLNRLHENRPVTTLIHGAARGVDTICGLWADEMGIPVESYPAQWHIHGRGAGPIRNKQMLDVGDPDALFAFPGGKGTADMVSRAEKVLSEVWVSKRIFFKKEDPDTWFLSNFAEGFGFEDSDGLWWDTSEHYYQAMKSPIPEEREYVRLSRTPAIAKKRGAKEINIYRNWDAMKDNVMRVALSYKFAAGTRASKLLLNTGIDYLIEYAPWGDTYWGVDKDKEGLNMLGKLLMERRDLLPWDA